MDTTSVGGTGGGGDATPEQAQRVPTPPLQGILETVLYYPVERESEVDRFYQEVMGMRPIGRKAGRFLFFRAGGSVFLLFNPVAALEQESPPPHGADGPGHVCFRVPPAAYDEWRLHLDRQGVEREQESRWRDGRRSFYFRDPAGNALEIADGDMWPP